MDALSVISTNALASDDEVQRALANSVPVPTLALLETWSWTSRDLPSAVRHLVWKHPGRPDAVLQLCPHTSHVNTEEGKVSYISPYTYQRTEFHGVYRVQRCRREEADELFVAFRYTGKRGKVVPVEHTLRASQRSSIRTYRCLQRWVVAEVVRLVLHEGPLKGYHRAG